MLPVWFNTLAVTWCSLLFVGMIAYGWAIRKPAVAHKSARVEKRRAAVVIPQQRMCEAA